MVHKRRIVLTGVHVDTPDWLTDPDGLSNPYVGYDGINPAWMEGCGCGQFEPEECDEVPATGTLTYIGSGLYHETHSEPPPGYTTGFVGPGGSDAHTKSMGTTAGTNNYPWTSMPSWGGCGGVGTGLIVGARHTGWWGRYTVTAKPADARAGLKVTIYGDGLTFPTPMKYMGIRVKRGAGPVRMWDGASVTTFPAGVDGYRSFFIPASLIPPVGEVINIGVVPVSLAVEGGLYCHEGTWPAFNGSGGSWQLTNFNVTAIAWVVPSCDVPPGHDFEQLPVGIGGEVPGGGASYTGWPTADGSAMWYVDGLLTPPLTYDDATGAVVFDRDVAPGAIVTQSGTGR